jgi:hypothetical protein
VTTLYLSLRISSFKVNVFNVIHHRRWAAKFAHPLFVALRFVPDAEYALLLSAIKGEKGIEGSEIRGLFLKDTWWRNADAKTVSWGNLTAFAESQHELGDLNPALDSIMRCDIRDARADKIS